MEHSWEGKREKESKIEVSKAKIIIIINHYWVNK